jgi:biotin transport system substrate-specific component
MTLPGFVSERVTKRSLSLNAYIVVTASLLLALSAQVSVPMPFSLVPMTLQPLALLLIGAVLGSRRGFAAAALYLAEGAIGMPVFAHGASGLPALLGPTAGYLMAFPAAAAVAGFLSERGWNRSVPMTMLSMSAALAVVYFSGWSWLAGVIGLGAETAFMTGVVPFMIGDVIKIAIAAVALPAAQKIISR